MPYNQKSLLTEFSVLVFSVVSSQVLTQTAKGKVLDAETGAPLSGTNVIVLNVDPPKGAITDEDIFFDEDTGLLETSFQLSLIPFLNYRLEF